MIFNRLFALLLLIFLSLSLVAQDEAESVVIGDSEIKLNALYLVLGAVEVQYEKVINEESAFGVSATYVFEEFSDWRWGITPHYRLYFGKKRAAGFFVEGNVSVLQTRYYDFIFDQVTQTGRSEYVDKVTAGVGIAVGTKVVTSRNVVVDAYLGLGRSLGGGGGLAFPRLGIVVGKRF